MSYQKKKEREQVLKIKEDKCPMGVTPISKKTMSLVAMLFPIKGKRSLKEPTKYLYLHILIILYDLLLLWI
jgi:hypothetical protein